MKTLLQINSVINSGSTGRIAEEIGKLAIAAGWNSFIAYARNKAESQSQKIKIGSKFDIYTHVLMTRLFDRHGLSSKTATKKFIQKIQEIKPDIIHLHNIHGYYLNYQYLFDYIAQSNIPVVWTLHDCWAFTGHCTHFEYIGCAKWISGCHNCPEKDMYPAAFLFDRSRKNFLDKKKSFLSIKKLTLVPVSDWLSDLCSQSFFSNIPIKRIYNGIDTDVFKPASKEEKKACLNKYNIKADFIILGVASIWSKRKGINDFIHLASLMPNDYHILLVGLSKKQIAMLPSNITGITRTENIHELAVMYSSADVFLNPTWEDSFPTTNLEALSCGTPVITYRTGGSTESISDDVGMIIEQGDVEGLYKAIKIIREKGKAHYSENCRKRAIFYYNKQDRYKDYLYLYDTLLMKKGDYLVK